MRRRKAAQGAANQVAQLHESFFEDLTKEERAAPSATAMKYALAVYGDGSRPLADAKQKDRSRFYIGLNVDPLEFVAITKKAILVSDTLMLSQDSTGEYVKLGEYTEAHRIADGASYGVPITHHAEYGMRCTDLEGLGRWILDSEQLMKAGLLWFLPPYVRSTSSGTLGWTTQSSFRSPVDYLVKDRRAVDASGATPVKSKVIRPILEMEIPYIDGVSLRDFSKITTNEFDSYSAFKNHLRQKLLEMDDAIENTQSATRLAALEEEIKGGVAEVDAKMGVASRARWWASSGATLCTVTVALTAVQDPKLLPLVAATGMSNQGIGNLYERYRETRRKQFRGEKWYYMWTIMKDGRPL